MATPVRVDTRSIPRDLAQLDAVFRQKALSVQLPIPSQKNGICVNDSLSTSLFYSDELRSYFWSKYILPYPQLEVSCHHTLTGLGPDGAQILNCWLTLVAARVAGILVGQPIAEVPSASATFRTQSETFGQPYAVGNTCGRLARLYTGVVVEESGELGLNIDYQDQLMTAVVSTEAPRLPGFAYVRGAPPPGSNPVAILLALGSPDQSSGHLVTIVRIGGIWCWCDNNVGYALPLPSGFDPTRCQFQYSSGSSYTVRWADGVNPSGSQTYPMVRAGSGRERTEYITGRRVLCVNPGAGATAGSLILRQLQMQAALSGAAVWQPTAQPPSSTGVASYGAAPGARNPYDPQAAVKDAFGTWNQGGRRRRKLTSRQSSLPKPKAPSSGHSRGYTRRRRALRSGTGGYQATKTGRKV
jgi:hypothetical protein